MSIDSAILHKLKSKRFATARDLLAATQLELVEALDLPHDQVEQLLLHVSTCVAPQSATVRQ